MRLIVNNEDLDIDKNQIVTFKRTQKLNGLQESYSFTNNFKLDKSSNNLRILNSNYLPNTKSKNMAQSIDCDVVFNDTIYLKKQQLKIKKDSKDFDSYVIFSESYLMTKAKELLMNEIDFGTTFNKTFLDIQEKNNPENNVATAPISAQDSSGLIVVEENNILIKVKYAIEKIFEKLGYTLAGDYILDNDFGNYFFSSDVGWYGTDGTVQFSESLTAFDFIEMVLETFNAYIDALDSTKFAFLNLWKNIESIKDRFIDYSEFFDSEKEYTVEDSLAKKNILKYNDSSSFYNSFFVNNKSAVKEKTYLDSKFGAGNMKLFSDQTVDENGTIPIRQVGEITDAKKLNLYRFNGEEVNVQIYGGGQSLTMLFKKAISPNILEIWEKFHKPYTDNISQPLVSLIDFKYNPLMLNDFKMQEVFFIKQLSSYWLPIEINYTSKKDIVTVKSLLVQKTALETPIVYDLSVTLGVNEEIYIVDLALLYASINISPAGLITIQNANLDKMFLYVNTTEVLNFPATFDVTEIFEIRIVNRESVSQVSNTNVSFTFQNQAGGISRLANINVTHLGYVNYVSEYTTFQDEVIEQDVLGAKFYVNFCSLNQNVYNIKNSFSPPIFYKNTYETQQSKPLFKVLEIQSAGWLTTEFFLEELIITAKNKTLGTNGASVTVSFSLIKNNSTVFTYATPTVFTSSYNIDEVFVFNNINNSYSTYVNSGDIFYIEIEGIMYNRASLMDGGVVFKNMNWKFTKTE